MKRVALLHGRDCLATTVDPHCVHWRDGTVCRFCGIEVPVQLQWSIGTKDPKQFGEVVKAAVDERICNHIALTTGDKDSPDRGLSQYYPFIREVKDYKDIPVYVQTSPPRDFRYLETLASLGVDSIGINIESFDPLVFSEACPGKAKSSKMEQYFAAWKYARVFGENQVSTFIIAGLGEDREFTRRGVEDMARLGGKVFLVSFRPVYGSLFQNTMPPPPIYVATVAREIGGIHQQYGLNPLESKAGCARCGACGLTQDAIYNDREIAAG